MRAIVFALLSIAPTASLADAIPNVMRGVWGVSEKECNMAHGPNYNTNFDFTKISTYDSTCLLTDINSSSAGITANASCEIDGEKAKSIVRISYTPTRTIVLEMRGPLWGEDGRVLALTRCWRQPKK